LGDSLQFTVFVNPPLKACIQTLHGPLNDTTLCFNQNLQLFSSGKGGAGTGYNFKWFLDKTLVSTADTFIISAKALYPPTGATKTLHLVLKDNCSQDVDSLNKNIRVIPSPKVDFSVGSTCNFQPIQFTFIGTKPALPLTTNFIWNFAGEANSSLESPSQKLNQTGKKTIKLTLSSNNGFTDIITKDIDIKAQAKANFIAEDVWEDSLALFAKKTTVTSKKANYRWYFGDCKTSTADTPSHQYNIGEITKTFNVKLAANIQNGCSDSITKAVTINANPKQGFSYISSGTTISFTANETNAANYH